MEKARDDDPYWLGVTRSDLRKSLMQHDENYLNLNMEGGE